MSRWPFVVFKPSSLTGCNDISRAFYAPTARQRLIEASVENVGRSVWISSGVQYLFYINKAPIQDTSPVGLPILEI